MLKKLLTTAGIFFASTSISYASAFYLAPTLGYQNVYIDKNQYQGIFPMLALGYGFMIPESYFYLGIEGFGVAKTFDLNNKPKMGNSLKTSYSYGASILPGYAFDMVFTGFIRLGAIYTNFSEINEQEWGGQIGIGFEACITPTWSLRGEYDFMKYAAINGIGQPRIGQYTAGIVFRFG